MQPISIFQLLPALAGGIGTEYSIGFSQKTMLFWLKPH